MSLKKLDPDLRSRCRELREEPVPARARARAPGAGEPDEIEILVEFTGALAGVEAAGFRARTVIDSPDGSHTIATGVIPVHRLEALAAVEHVVEVEGPRRMEPMLDYSLPTIRATSLHTDDPEFKGQGVVVGVIDSGIDWRHGAFVIGDGGPGPTSRILGLWDHFLTAEGSESAGPAGVGVVYTRQNITDALQSSGTVRSFDKNAKDEVSGHGSHVAGIAAGDGSPATCCHTGGTYVGVAPRADILFVRYDYTEDTSLGANVRLVDALDWIFHHPDAAGKPVVINISQGDNLGPHDGTTLVERTIDNLVTAQSGRAVVVAAGNFAQTKCHVEGTVGGNDTVEIPFKTHEKFELWGYLDLWYARAGTLDIEVVAPGGQSSGTVNHGSDHTFVANPGAPANRQYRVDIDGTIHGPHGRDNNFRIRIRKPNDGNIPAGDWTLRLENPNAGDVDYHCWIERGPYAPDFEDGGPESTISTPSTAREAIAVANYAGRTGLCDCCPDEDIVPSSSRGPVARDAAANPKPDIAAPGKLITAPKADAANLQGNWCDCCADACCCLYQDKTGTSMAAPHVAGVIALMLEKNPQLTKAEILTHLQASVQDPAPADHDTWGAGKINAAAAVERVPDPAPMPTPPDAPAPSRVASPASATAAPASPAARPAHAPLPAPTAGPPGLFEAMRVVRARALALPEGPVFAALLSRHFSEGRRLINTNRRIATMWHRGDGPQMLRRLVHGAVDADGEPPIAAEKDREYLDRMMGMFAEHGSESLRRSIERYSDALIRMLQSPLAAQVASAQEPA